MLKRTTLPSHGTVAGYMGLILGVLALTGGTAFAARMLDGKSIKNGSIRAVKLHKASVTSVKLARNAVGTAKVRNKAITAAKLAANSVTGASIAPGSISASDLSSSALTTLSGPVGLATPSSIGESAVTSSKLADAAVTTSKLADEAVTGVKIADGSVPGTKIPLRIVTTDSVVGPASIAAATASCPAGTRAFGGGVTLDDPSVVAILSAVRQSQPVTNAAGAPAGWAGSVVGLAGLPGNTPFHVYAVCG
jgi:hypothetical protein